MPLPSSLAQDFILCGIIVASAVVDVNRFFPSPLTLSTWRGGNSALTLSAAADLSFHKVVALR